MESSVVAQTITLDSSLGSARILGNGPNYLIQQADGTTVGRNLFHSLGRFNLATGEQVGFQSSAIIRNILARVVGGSVSSIDGLIFTESPAVNFFLINPAGIVFGPNAQLDIGGTTRGDFTATTLDAIVWPDGSRFDAINPGNAQPLLRIVGDPSGFGITSRPIPGISVNEGVLRVSDTQNLRLLGGEVVVNRGRLVALGGRVELGAMLRSLAGPTAEPETVLLSSDGGLGFVGGLARGDVRFENGAGVFVAGVGGGDISITARDI
ncbi:MAG: filamentous hemagglutinin N-terminal domain-containing protein, partial [Synechococcales cyanobacterium RU_4_20]|nr:filamentous hemagglutinin N-terminal domain-containing protein [Synechococcales cyanobacterium RU_4_20]